MAVRPTAPISSSAARPRISGPEPQVRSISVACQRIPRFCPLFTSPSGNGPVKKSSATRWNTAPFALGAMSAASPGGQPSRKILMEPVGSIFLAGEATHETLWGTVDGAWESGERAAEAALRKIGALKDDEPPQPVSKKRKRS